MTEDQAFNDPTTNVLVPTEVQAVGMIRAKADGVLAGVDVAMEVFRRVNASLETRGLLEDGAVLIPGGGYRRGHGSGRRHPAGRTRGAEFPATHERHRQRHQPIRSCNPGHQVPHSRHPQDGAGAPLPGQIRRAHGGRYNHRLNLADGILIKDNHIEALRSREMGLRDVIQLALSRASHTIKVEVEVETLEGVREAVDAGAHIIMLDNMPLESCSKQWTSSPAGRW